MEASLLVSVVTPCLNRARFIAQAVESVLAQAYPRCEHIVVDGGSTDDTLKILARYPHLRVISEPDRGVYDALNKGIRAARGEVVAHLNSDDLYPDGSLAEMARCFASGPELDAVYGGASVFEDAAGARRIVAEYLTPADIGLTLRAITLGVPIINARFFRRRVYDRLGLYDASLRIAADREFLLRVQAAEVPAATVPRCVYWYRRHPGSLTIVEGGPFRRATLWEYLWVAEARLGRGDLSAEARRCCLEWHRREAAEGFVASAREGRFPEAMRFWLRGWRRDPGWLVAFPARVLPRLAARLSRGRDERG